MRPWISSARKVRYRVLFEIFWLNACSFDSPSAPLLWPLNCAANNTSTRNAACVSSVTAGVASTVRGNFANRPAVVLRLG